MYMQYQIIEYSRPGKRVLSLSERTDTFPQHKKSADEPIVLKFVPNH
jgi:hypothetical protein